MLVSPPVLSPETLRLIIENEFSIHPLCEAQDIFKLVYQAATGPTHIIPDLEQIATGIAIECSNLTTAYKPFTQDIGAGSGFIRLSLSRYPGLVNDPDMLISLAQGILDSRLESDLSIKEMNELWQITEGIIDRINPMEKQQTNHVHQMIQNQQIPRHSQTFREAYAPHYRLVHNSIYNRLRSI